MAVDTFDLMERCPIPLITICRPAKTLRNITTIDIAFDATNIADVIIVSVQKDEFWATKDTLDWGVLRAEGGWVEDLVIRAMFTTTPCSLSPPHAPSPSRALAKQDATRISTRCTSLFQPNPNFRKVANFSWEPTDISLGQFFYYVS